jgi:hypothetical protein
MWRLLLLCVVGACGFQISNAPGDPIDGGVDPTDIDAEPANWLPGYAHRKSVTIQSGQSITLEDFVVAIVIAEDPDLAARARDDGQDITITAANGAILEYELERFDGQTGALAMWVRVPALESATTVFMYYGGEIRLHDARATWSEQTFRAVWHMTDAVGTLARDSAGDHDLASTGGTNLPVLQDGIAGVARGFDGSNDMLRDDGDDNSLDFGTQPFSYSVWVYIAQSQGLYDMPMFKGGAISSQPGYDIELGTNNWSMYVGDGSTNRAVTVANETLNTWVHIVIVVDRAAQVLRGFKDGIEVQKVDITDIGSMSSSSTFTIGSNGSAYFMRGRVDEPRVYARALAPEWIAAEHANLRSPSTFTTVGAEEAAPP